VFEGDAVTSAVFPLWLEIAMGNDIDEQDDSLALVAVTVAAVVVVVVVREEGSNSEAIVNFSSRTTSAEKGAITVHSMRVAARPAAVAMFHASEKTAQNLAFVLC
jgi:hypothetical protein